MKRTYLINHLNNNLTPLQKTFVNSVRSNAKKYANNFDGFEHRVREYADKMGYCVSTFVDETQLRVAENQSFATDDFIVITCLPTNISKN